MSPDVDIDALEHPFYFASLSVRWGITVKAIKTVEWVVFMTAPLATKSQFYVDWQGCPKSSESPHECGMFCACPTMRY
jgi:hypothetical protein